MAEIELNDHSRYAILRHLPVRDVVRVGSILNNDWRRCTRSAHFIGDIRRFLVLKISGSTFVISDRRHEGTIEIISLDGFDNFLESPFTDAFGTVAISVEASELDDELDELMDSRLRAYFAHPRVFVERLSIPLRRTVGFDTFLDDPLFRMMTGLKSLDIVGGNDINALVQISVFPQVTNLTVSSVPLAFFRVSRLLEFSQLTSLDIRRCLDAVDNDFVKRFLLELTNLERLAVTTCSFLPSLRRCAKLTKLTIVFNGLRVDTSQSELAENEDSDDDEDDNVCAQLNEDLRREQSQKHDAATAKMIDCTDLSLPTIVDYELILEGGAFFGNTASRSTIYLFICLAPNARRFRLASRCQVDKEGHLASQPGQHLETPPWEFECLAEAAQRSRLVALERFELEASGFSAAPVDEARAVSFLIDFFTSGSIHSLRSVIIKGVRFGDAEQIERILRSQAHLEYIDFSLAFSLHHTENVNTKYERLAAVLKSVSASTSLRSVKIRGYVVPRAARLNSAERIFDDVERLRSLHLEFRLYAMSASVSESGDESVEGYEFRLCRICEKKGGQVREQLLSVLVEMY